MDLKDKIHKIRDQQVMLDSDLAELYGVEVKYLNRQVRRNIKRFPSEFCFQLNKEEFLRCQFVTSKIGRGGRTYLPYVFTEQGVSMLSAILKSDTAIEISIKVMKAFVQMRKFMQTNANIFQKFQEIDQKLIVHDKNFEEVFQAIESRQITPKQGIFYDGEVFDSFNFVLDLVKQAKKKIILIDNYVDETTFTIFSNKLKGVSVRIYTKNISEKLDLLNDKFNEQYGGLQIITFNKSHDRFLFIDDDCYHIGASLKDLGKKWFAFSKLDGNNIKIRDMLSK